MKKTLLLVLLASTFIIAQAPESLIQASLQNHRNPRILDSLSRELLKFQEPLTQARGFFLSGLSNTYQGNAAGAQRNFQKSLALLDPKTEYRDAFNYFVVLKNLGIAHYRNGNSRQGDSCFRLLARESLAKNDTVEYAIALKSIGTGFLKMQRYDSAVHYLTESAMIQESINYPGLASAYLSVGSVFGSMNQNAEAIRWFKKAREIAEERRDERMLNRIYNNLGVAYRLLDHLDSSNAALEKALKLSERAGSVFDQMGNWQNLARNSLKLGDQQSFINQQKKVSALMRQNGDAPNVRRSSHWMLQSEGYLKFQQAHLAKPYLDSIQAFELQNLQRELVPYYNLKAEYYEQLKEQDSALSYLKKVREIEQGLLQGRDATKIKEVASRMELERINQEKQVAKKDAEFWKNIFALGGTALMAVLILLFLYRKKQKAAEAQVEEAQKHVAVVEGQLKMSTLAQQQESTKEAIQAQVKLKSKAIINVEELIYVASEGHYINYHLREREKPEVDRNSLSKAEEQLSDYGFVRIHRSYLIKVSAIKALYAAKVLLNDGTELPVSRTYKDAIRERFES